MHPLKLLSVQADVRKDFPLSTLSGIQMNLLRKLAKEYNVPFSKDMVKNLIGALLARFPGMAC